MLSLVNGVTKYSWKAFTYDESGKTLTEITGKELVDLEATTSNIVTRSNIYNQLGQLSEKNDSEGRKTTYIYNVDGNIEKELAYTDAINSYATVYRYNDVNKLSEKEVYVRAGDVVGNEFANETLLTLMTSYEYDLNGNLIKVTSPENKVRHYTYDNMNRQIKESYLGEDEYGVISEVAKETEYASDGKVLSQKNEAGHLSQFIYDKAGNLIQTVDPLGNRNLMAYDRAGRKIAEVSPESYQAGVALADMERSEFSYDLMGRLAKHTHIYKAYTTDATLVWTPSWVSVVSNTYHYDSLGNVTKAQNASGYGTISSYNLAGMLETVTDAEGKARNISYSTKYTYNGLLQKTMEQYPDGLKLEFTYDSNGNVITMSVNGSVKKTMAYDRLGRALTETDAKGTVIQTKSNAFSKTATIVTPSDVTQPGYTKNYQYTLSGNLARVEDSFGVIEENIYDSQARIISASRKKADGTQKITVTSAYDLLGNKRFETDGNGSVTEYRYDALNRLVMTKKTVSGKEKTTLTTYDGNGNKMTETDYLGNITTMTYDGINRLIEVTDAAGNSVQKITYNDDNTQSHAYDALGNRTSFVYDKNQRVISTIDAMGNEVKQSYDNRGNVATQTDGKGNITTFKYNEQNHLQSVVNALGETTLYAYDINGNRLSQTDGNNHTTTYTYNAFNQMTQTIAPRGTGIASKTESYSYYANGLLKDKLDKNGKTTTYVYDSHGRLIREDVAGEVVTYTYDNNGNCLTQTDAAGTTTRSYDELGRVTSKTVPLLGQSTYAYDITEELPQGYHAESTTDPSGQVTTKVYDQIGRLSKVVNNEETTTYTYYANGNRKDVTYPTGAKEVYSYNKNNKVTQLVNIDNNATVIQTYSYTYDKNNSQLTKTENKGTTTYSYDGLDRLSAVTEPSGKQTTYTYDKAGNRSTENVTMNGATVLTKYAYDDQNRLVGTDTVSALSTKHTTYIYDNNGNMSSKVISTTKPLTEVTGTAQLARFELIIKGEALDKNVSFFSYNNKNQLVKLVEGSTTSTYAYNPDGYRVEKSVNGNIIRYLYEGDKVVLETNSTNTVTSRNIYGTNLLAREVENDVLYYMYNAHGDVTALLNTAGAIVATYDYDAFGTIIEETGTANNTIKYAGYQYDQESELYYLNARYYEPKIARFLTEDCYRGQVNDPLSLNRYSYVSNNPIKYWDPTGHWQEGDTRLTTNAQSKIIALTNAYHEAESPEERKKISAEAEKIRKNKENQTNSETSMGRAINVAYEKGAKKYLTATEWATTLINASVSVSEPVVKNYTEVIGSPVLTKSTSSVITYGAEEHSVTLTYNRLSNNYQAVAKTTTEIILYDPTPYDEGMYAHASRALYEMENHYYVAAAMELTLGFGVALASKVDCLRAVFQEIAYDRGIPLKDSQIIFDLLLMYGTYKNTKGFEKAYSSATNYFNSIFNKGTSNLVDDGMKVFNEFDVSNAYVKPKHLSTSGGNGQKFLGDSKAGAEEILHDAMKNGKVVNVLDNGPTQQGNKSFEIIIDAGKTVGTKGEQMIKIVLSEDGGMLSAYPIK